MNQEKLWHELKSLPLEAQREVLDFIAFLRARYKPRHPNDKLQKVSLLDEPFIGMWRDREDMEDSSKWVRGIRQGEWTGS